MENTIRYKPEVETVPQTESINNLATKIDIDAISVAIPMFLALVFTDVYANLIRRFLNPNVPRGVRIPEVVITVRRKTISK